VAPGFANAVRVETDDREIERKRVRKEVVRCTSAQGPWGAIILIVLLIMWLT
jgi:hypothetical protein